jgi:hypothetical protein
MGDCSEIYGCRPNGQLCDQNFWYFCWKSFLFESRVRTVRHCCPDGRTFAASNFHIRLSCVRTKGDGRPDGWSSTRNFHIYCARVRTMKGRRLAVEVKSAISISIERPSGLLNWNCDSCLKEKRVRTEIHVVRTVVAIFPYIILERIGSLIEYWRASGQAAESSGRMQAGLEASRCSEGSERMMLGLSGVRTVWHVVRTDGIVDRWASGQDRTVVRTTDREPILLTCTQCRFSETLLNSGIPVKSIFTYKWFCPKQHEANHKLTSSNTFVFSVTASTLDQCYCEYSKHSSFKCCTLFDF